MTVIGFDTATADTAVAVSRDGSIVCERTVAPAAGGRPRHATSLLVEIERAAGEAGGWDSVQRIAVGVGPGSYTGLRVGIVTARTLAGALAKPLAAVSSLAALAAGIESPEGGRRLAVIDARRGEVFAALHEAGTVVWEPFVASAQSLADRLSALPQPPRAAGDGAIRFRGALEAAGVQIPPDDDPAHRLLARHVCALGEASAPSPPEQVVPLYLRPPDAEVWLERDRQ